MTDQPNLAPRPGDGTRLADYDYHLPEERIAQTPLEPRDSSRLMVYHRATGQVEHRHFYDLPEYLHPGDALACNQSRVIPARTWGTRRTTGARVEFMLVRRLDTWRWQALCKPAKRVRAGEWFDFSPQLTAQVEAEGADGLREITFYGDGVFETLLAQVGTMPLPPYIHQKLADPERYQTVYATANGSTAAPTAGLHFTPRLLAQLQGMGVQQIHMTLHVGLGTFRPVSVENLDDHHMHSETYELTPAAADALNATRAAGGRIVAVGTTSVRILETCAAADRIIRPGSGDTDIFIRPGYTFNGVDALITNFHLPQSTLLMLVSAMVGREQALALYRMAVEEQYRFFSFGDAMLIL